LKFKYIQPIDFVAFKNNVDERKNYMASMIEEFEMLRQEQ
jgi:hypothetical protein